MELWTSLPWWIRVPIALLFPVIGLIHLCVAERVYLGAVGVMVALGAILLFLGPSDSDKNGYKF